MEANNESTRNRAVFILSLIGIAIAVYVTQSFIRKTGIYCVNSGGCEAVRKAPESYLFGYIPVPAVGLLGYAIIAICAFLNTIRLPNRYSLLPTRIMLGMSSFGVLFVTWFTYTELVIIKGICMWCAISAANMYIIFAISWSMYWQDMKKTIE